MPESQEYPGNYWTTADCTDKQALFERTLLPTGHPERLIPCVGHTILQSNGDIVNGIVVFTPEGVNPAERGNEMRDDLGGLWHAGRFGA